MTSAAHSAELVIGFPAKPAFVGVARHVAAAMARLHGAGDDVVDDVKLAVSEACTNAVTQASRLTRPPAVRVTMRTEGADILIEVTDGGSLQQDGVARAGSAQAATRSGEGGLAAAAERSSEEQKQLDGFDSEDFSFETNLSLPLLRGLVDELDIHQDPSGGTVVRMRIPTGGEQV